MQSKLEHEVFRKTPDIALNRFIEAPRADAIQSREIAIENDSAPTQEQNGRRNLFQRNECRTGLLCHVSISLMV